jgi:cysteine desulfurase
VRRIYLDWNATAPPHPDVLAAIADAQRNGWANPASSHGPGRRARAYVEAAREAVAALLGFDARDVVLTGGGTEANNLAITHAFSGDVARSLVVSGVEHPSVGRFADALAARGVAVERAAPEPSGAVAVASVVDAVGRASARAPVALVSLQAVNHETGVLQPVAEVREALPSSILLHVDAVQAVGRVDAARWAGADLVTMAAHKIRGPKGVGAIATRAGVTLRPVLLGGAQERGLRPGTQDGAACAGLAVAAALARSTPAAYAAVGARRDAFEARLVGAGRAARNGDAPRAPHVSNLSFAGWHGDELAAALDLEGVACSSGAACSAGTAELSVVVAAMLGPLRAASALRFSAGAETSAADFEDAADRVARVVERARGGR